jgi:type IV secretory pathway TrbF-like protein
MTLFSFLGKNRPPKARHVEIWGELEATNHFLRRMAVAACVWAFLALSVAAYALNLALFHPLAFYVDGDGRSSYVGRLRQNAAPTEPEVRYVAKQFLTRYAALNSLTIESDLADAWNFMTAELRGEHERQLADYRRDHQKDFVAWVKEQAIQMSLEFPADKIRVTEHNGKAWSVRLIGVARTWPLSRVGDPSASTDRDLEALVTLVRCPRTEQTPNGLLVATVTTRFYVADTSGATGPGAQAPPADPPAAKPDPAPVPAPNPTRTSP